MIGSKLTFLGCSDRWRPTSSIFSHIHSYLNYCRNQINFKNLRIDPSIGLAGHSGNDDIDHVDQHDYGDDNVDDIYIMMHVCLSVTKNDHFLSALAERLWPSDGDDDDAHLDCSQVNQQADCQTTSTASQLPWLIVLFEDGDDGDYGNERDDPNKRR